MQAGRMGFLFIRKTASTSSSATGALVAANSLQPIKGWFWDVVRQLYTNVGWLFIFGNKEPSMLWKSFF
jgi:hypothetical protein